jgi:hypothetical protein
MMFEGFLLGLSTCTVCLATCAPVMVPFFLAEGRPLGSGFWALLQFLGGRLIGYGVFAVLAWGLGQALGELPAGRGLLLGAATVLLSAVLIIYGFGVLPLRPLRHDCPAEPAAGWRERVQKRWPFLLPVLLGFLTGLNLCPPFLLALTRAAGGEHPPGLAASLLFFLAFFLGTSVCFVPMPLLGTFRRLQVLKILGRLAAGLVGIYLLVSGGISMLAALRS